MTTVAPDPVPTSEAGNPIGFGRMQRKEDVRFVRGKGHYLDDLTMPGMLHGAILRSPYAHAKINSIATTRVASSSARASFLPLTRWRKSTASEPVSTTPSERRVRRRAHATLFLFETLLERLRELQQRCNEIARRQQTRLPVLPRAAERILQHGEGKRLTLQERGDARPVLAVVDRKYGEGPAVTPA